MPDLPPVLYLIGLIIAASPGLYAIWRSRRKLDAETDKAGAEAASALTGSALDMVKRWEARVLDLERQQAEQQVEIESLKERVAVLESENECLRRGAERLEGQVVSLGHVPVWRVSELAEPKKKAGSK